MPNVQLIDKVVDLPKLNKTWKAGVLSAF